MVYMIHNQSSQPLAVYIVLDVVYEHGTLQQLNAPGMRPHHSLTGVVFGRTFNVPRNPGGPGTYESVRDDPKGPIEWTSTMDGTIIATGGHLHPGGIEVKVSNFGRRDRPCAATPGGFGGTLLFRPQAVYRKAPWSSELQVTGSRGAWRAPIHKGDRIRVDGIYENRDHAWYYAMAFGAFYIDPKQPPRGDCRPYLIGAGARAPAAAHSRRTRHRARRGHRRRHGPRRVASPTRPPVRAPALDPTLGVLTRP